MKYLFVMLIFVFPFFVGSACNSADPALDSTRIQNNDDEDDNSMSTKITVRIGDKKFVATLSDNATATSVKALLPMTITMNELNGSEKYFDLASSLPTNASRPSSIQTGDLMMYGSRTLVLFYKIFSTTYTYTKLGRIDDTTGLTEALGAENVTVIFEIQ